MTSSIGSTGRPSRPRRVRGRRAGDSAPPPPPGGSEAASASEPARPVPPADLHTDGGPAFSAQLMGQSGPAEGAAPADSARQASRAYLKVEWSGRRDRRTRRGGVARTEA